MHELFLTRHPRGGANAVQGEFEILGILCRLQAAGVVVFADSDHVVAVSRSAIPPTTWSELRTHAEALHRQLLREQDGRPITEQAYWSRLETRGGSS